MIRNVVHSIAHLGAERDRSGQTPYRRKNGGTVGADSLRPEDGNTVLSHTSQVLASQYARLVSAIAKFLAFVTTF